MLILASIVFGVAALARGQGTVYPTPVQGDYLVREFPFKSGERLSELKLHYYTIGSPVKDTAGKVRNAVLILHGTGGSGANFLTTTFGGVLFGPGQPLDATKYYIILPDNLGQGRSSKPSDGLHMRFPHYEYDDLVELQYRLVTQGLGVNHLRLVMGTSQGGMHTWMWGEHHPDFMDALMPLASNPTEIAGRNRMLRRMISDAIRNDPEWNNGEYQKQPRGLADALHILLIMGSSPLQMQKLYPTRERADAYLEEYVARQVKTTDANDMLYYFNGSRNYNPEPDLEKIIAPLTAINSADDQVNPPELGICERDIRRVKKGKFVLLPITGRTRGHGTHSLPALWQEHLVELLKRSESK